MLRSLDKYCWNPFSARFQELFTEFDVVDGASLLRDFWTRSDHLPLLEGGTSSPSSQENSPLCSVSFIRRVWEASLLSSALTKKLSAATSSLNVSRWSTTTMSIHLMACGKAGDGAPPPRTSVRAKDTYLTSKSSPMQPHFSAAI